MISAAGHVASVLLVTWRLCCWSQDTARSGGAAGAKGPADGYHPAAVLTPRHGQGMSRARVDRFGVWDGVTAAHPAPCCLLTQPLYELSTTWDSTVKEVRAAVCAATGLKVGSMILARGRMGQRISDSSDNLFRDDETMWECGFSDGDEVAYMYMSDGTLDLAKGPPAS